jgi:cell division protein FtsZ
MGILTIGVVTKPFSFEGKRRAQLAEEGIGRMKQAVDSLIIIPNDKVLTMIDKKTTFQQAFLSIDKVLLLGIQGITELIQKPGMINVDFSDIKTFMSGSGTAMIGIGYGAGETRAIDASRKAIEHPLLESQLDKAKNIIFAVTG